MSDLGMAVEEIEVLGEGLDGIVVARVLDLRPHPTPTASSSSTSTPATARRCRSAAGPSTWRWATSCRSPPSAPPCPTAWRSQRRKLRGEWSNGMLCSAAELGLGDDHGGILRLPADLEPGQPAFEALGIDPTCSTTSRSTRNRPDAMSVAGVARDLAARLGVPFALPEPGPPRRRRPRPALVSVEILDPDLCGRFVAPGCSTASPSARRPVDGRQPHRCSGMRPINNVVDVSNYVMLELGQPNHPYDLATLAGGGFRVRRARAGDETLTTLDDVERSLTPGDLLICDATTSPIGIAGVMGGAVHRDLRDHHRGPPRDGLVRAAGIARTAAPRPAQRGLGPLRAGGRPGFATAPADGGLEVAVPSWRPDCESEIDLVEEVARHFGYERLGKTVPTSAHPGRLAGHQLDRRLLRQVLLGAGCSEVMPSPLVSPDDLAAVGLDPAAAIALTNPMVREESVLRTSLLPGLVGAVAVNEARQTTGVSLFEIAHVYLRSTDRLPDERERLGVVLAGREAPAAVELWHELAASLDVSGWTLAAAELPGLHPTRTALVRSGEGSVLAVVGEVDPEVLRRNGVAQRVAWLELELDPVYARQRRDRRYRPVSRFPASEIDLAFALPEAVPAAELTAAIREGAGELLVDLRLFDTYRGPGVPDGSRSLAYRLRLQSLERTLTDAEVAGVRAGVVAAAAAAGA
jgi:phenylalanyl-tRNA synthetase beta subunit